MAIGQKFTCEIESWVDPEYGYKIIHPKLEGETRTLYFTSNPFLEDGKNIIITIKLNGFETMYKLNFHTGDYYQLTENKEIHPTISYIDRKRQIMYMRTPKEILSVDLNTFKSKVVLKLEDVCKDSQELIPSVAITCDGKYLITGYKFNYTFKNNDQQSLGQELYRIFKVNLETLEQSDIRYTSYIVDHIQCSSTDPEYFIYCCWGYYATHQRVWGCNIHGTVGGPLGNEIPIEHRTHEYFIGNSEEIAYHGKFMRMVDGRFKKFADSFGVMNVDGSNDRVYMCPEGYSPGHSAMSSDKSIIIADGNDKISFIKLDDKTMTCNIIPIFSHNTSMTGNMNHPQPSISQNNRYVCFASDFRQTKTTNFYIIDLESKK